MEPGFHGNQFLPGTAAYQRANDLYATSTYGKERNMNPSEILQPSSIEDIQELVKIAARQGKPIAICWLLVVTGMDPHTSRKVPMYRSPVYIRI